ncbi:MAG: amidase [Geminicoccaceae bacterium]
MATDLTCLSALELAALIKEGKHSSEEVVEAHLGRIESVDPAIQAWAFLDPDYARAQARIADAARKDGKPLGPLHGVPVGVKDIIDTHDMPTESGTVLDEGRRPAKDAVVVERLRAAGAILLGKTVTTELAYYAPSKTRNPHDPSRTPGGSSSGSAAAVASHMAPVAIGTQTNGSVIRPASFCGTVGYKPTFGLIPRTGVLAQSFHLDTIGTFGRSLGDAALLADCLIGHDSGDPATKPVAALNLAAAATSKAACKPKLGFVRTPVWDQAEASTEDAFSSLVDQLDPHCVSMELPAPFETGHQLQRLLMTGGFAFNLGHYETRGRDLLSQHMQMAINVGREVRAHDYLHAAAMIEVFNDHLSTLFETCDAILTPAAPGAAPKGLGSTGNPAFCTLWTLCGTPAITLPLLKGDGGLPLGVQLVGPRGGDVRLMQTAAWLAATIEGKIEA